jgi:hypothetical protein
MPLGASLLRRRLLATVLLLLHARQRTVIALKDGLDAQLFPCDPLNVRQRWRLDQGSSSGGSSGAGGGAGHLHLIWAGVDPPLTQTLVHLADGVGPHPREVQGGQLTTWSLHGAHPPAGAGTAATNCSAPPHRLGCFGDNAVDRMLNDQSTSGPNMSQAVCTEFCRNPGWPGGP